jgi:hypothetical protein
VVLLTPIFVGLSGWVAELAVRYLPGTPALDRGELTAVFIAGMTAAATAAVKWLHGRSQHTQNEQKQELEVALAEVRNAPVAGLAAAQTAGVSPAVPARRRRTPKPPAAAVAVPQMGLLLAAAAGARRRVRRDRAGPGVGGVGAGRHRHPGLRLPRLRQVES